MAGPPRRPPQQAERDQRPRVTSRTGEQLVGALSKIVTAVMARAGIAESPHALRHTVATRLVRDSTQGPVLVADIVGHADTETTRRYALSDLESAAPAFGDLAD
jgi:integrase